MKSPIKLLVYIISLSLILVAYNNCGNSFQAAGDFSSELTSKRSTGPTPAPVIVKPPVPSSFEFTLENNNAEKNSYFGKLNDLQVSFIDSNPLEAPTITSSGFLCSDAPVAIKIIRYFETNTNDELINDSRKHILRSDNIIPASQSNPEVNNLCGNGNFNFNISKSFENLKINTDILGDDKYIHNDYFLIEVSDESLPESTLASPMSNQLPDKIAFIDPHTINNPEPPEPMIGAWGPWTEKKIGDCNNGKQSFELIRTCNDNLECKTVEDKLSKTETKTEQRNCTVTPPPEPPKPPGNVYNPPDVVNGIKTPRAKTFWSDSYSVDGQCYCDTANFDHGLINMSANTPNGRKKITQICADLKRKFGTGKRTGRVYFNDIQCGHGPANDARDEKVCPGIPRRGGDYTGPRCNEKGSSWNLDKLYD